MVVGLWMMSWFGCKASLRKSQWAVGTANAGEMVQYLQTKFANDNSKEYHLVDERRTAELRKAGCEENVLKGRKAAHVI